ncbi:MAG: hypothetical protein M1268_04130 [Patescibacteria group bacterium]|nr:hypothetical protein [Patescibacteria group bacterium]
MAIDKPNKIKAGSTQKFTEIVDIEGNIVFLTGGNACLITEIQATNFSLLSREEQNTKIYSYASLLNSLSFPIQVLIRNKKVDISSYLKLLEEEVKKSTNEKLSLQISLYHDFVQELIKVNEVLDKKFYIVIPYSPLEKGAASVIKDKNSKEQAKQALDTKSSSLNTQLARLGLKAKTLEKEELVKLYYSVYNEEAEENTLVESNDIKTPMITAQKSV